MPPDFQEFYNSVVTVKPEYWQEQPPEKLPLPLQIYVCEVIKVERIGLWVKCLFATFSMLFVVYSLLLWRAKPAKISLFENRSPI